jgi:isoleucyl-tRNA synthetase
VLDQLHRCLCTWFAPVLVFTAEEAWAARFGEDSSVHLQNFPSVPDVWRDPALAARWAAIRDNRAAITGAVEVERREKRIGSSLEALVTLQAGSPAADLLNDAAWAELAIVSQVTIGPAAGAPVTAQPATGSKCVRCWRVLPEVGRAAAHPTLCLRCADAVTSGLVCAAPAPATP